MTANLTLAQSAETLRAALAEYIEATYHISDPMLVRQRRNLLAEAGVIAQVPFIESTPRYRSGEQFEQVGLPPEAVDMLVAASQIEHDGSPLVHNPPYEHQAEALRQILVQGRSIVVTTGTGSGKTECFLLPILGRLAIQASNSQSALQKPAVRALVLYPMNALVNDQLGRLRLLLGNPGIVKWFADRWGRPARFGRYTSRTLYPGIRSSKRDQARLRPLSKYYVQVEREINAQASPESDPRFNLRAELKRRGKWPAKPDLVGWWGADGARWQDAAGNFVRCITQPLDPELLTRHEVLDNPPDILITNYSMLEYMLMRPLERQLFDKTRDWLSEHPTETFIVVVDEAHLYRGAAGAEVGFLLRRLRDRLGIPADRLQVICTTASFAKAEDAPTFGAALSGKVPSDFISITGELALPEDVGPGSAEEAAVLAAVELEDLYADSSQRRQVLVEAVLRFRDIDVDAQADPRTALYAALSQYGPMKLLIRETMQRACAVEELSAQLFPGTEPSVALRAASALVALGSYARDPNALDGPGLLPSRLHGFFRGLPGLWVCMDPQCSGIPDQDRGGAAGRLFPQPRIRCDCGARVFELYTCRHCGTAYARTYTDNLDSPGFLWSEHGQGFESVAGQVAEMHPLDLLLGQPIAVSGLHPADLDLVTGRLDPRSLSDRSRIVYLPDRIDDNGVRSGEFVPCAVCNKSARFGKSSVQDHQTRGDEPFRALVTRQVEIQQPTGDPSPFAPMAGRKVLVFSDSRQTAARLAPNLQKYTTQDAVRPLLLVGFDDLLRDPEVGPHVSLEESYLAVVLASIRMGVRLRPPTRVGETYDDDVGRARQFLEAANVPTSFEKLQLLLDFRTRSQTAPEALTSAVHAVTNDKFTGFAALALATLEPTSWEFMADLPPMADEIDDEPQVRSVVTTWLDAWPGPWVQSMPSAWAEDQIRPAAGKFGTRMQHVLATKANRRIFEKDWLPILLANLAQASGNGFRLRGANLTLALGGDWGYCQTCRSTQRPLPGRPDLCVYCGQSSIRGINPDSDTVFLARKGYYRQSALAALRDGRQPLALVAAEHTAQLNEAQADAVFSEAEENELLFQDVDLGDGKPAIDVLSCTTTMEVGIDIGALAGVALRNMPPSRANYQQRSGRAGRRGHAVATVTAFASAESHDEHGFSAPDEFIRGPVIDPEMSLGNWQIARRHLTAWVLQEYLSDRLPTSAATQAGYGSQLFEVLGSVDGFKDPRSPLNRLDFRSYVQASADFLADRAAGWLPGELLDAAKPDSLVPEIRMTADIVDEAIGAMESARDGGASNPPDEAGESVELPAEAGDANPQATTSPETLLGRLLYKGALPRYAFPTDVGTFHVFDVEATTNFRPAFLYTPGQGMPVALSQYAPGRRIWIGGREWISGAIYSRWPEERFAAWENRLLYLECSVCHYATTVEFQAANRGDMRDCPACASLGALGPAQLWIRPPGFAHPYSWSERTLPDDDVPASYATKAKLTTEAPSERAEWTQATERISLNFARRQLLVTNRGPEADGYSYCTRCGLVEPTAQTKPMVIPGHRKPFPDTRQPICPGDATARAVVFGTDFISDVLLIGLSVDEPWNVQPQFESTRIALRTLSDALVIRATQMLGIASAELQAEFRPALTAAGQAGRAAEIYVYDTLPGGAGFSRRVGELGRGLFDATLRLLEDCPANCDASCYRCLQSYKNRSEHNLLDRHLGASLLRYLLTSVPPSVDQSRTDASTDLLFDDLVGLGLEGVQLGRSVGMAVPGFGELVAPILVERDRAPKVVIALHHPCAPGLLLHDSWTEPAEYGAEPIVVRIDELTVRRNLPWASHQVLRDLGLV